MGGFILLKAMNRTLQRKGRDKLFHFTEDLNTEYGEADRLLFGVKSKR